MADGNTYIIGKASQEQVSEWIDVILKEYGSFEILKELKGETQTITGVSTATKVQTILRSLPQYLIWEIRPTTDGVLMRLEERNFRWYKFLIVGMCAIMCIALWVGWILMFHYDKNIYFSLSTSLLFIFLVLAFFTSYLINPKASEYVLDQVHLRAFQCSYSIESKSTGLQALIASKSSRFLWLLFAAMLTPLLFSLGNLFRISSWAPLALISLLLLIFILLLISNRIKKNSGFELRSPPTLFGMITCMILLSILWSQFPIWMIGSCDQEIWNEAFLVRSMLHNTDPETTTLILPKGEVSVAELNDKLASFKGVIMGFLLPGFGFWVLAMFFSVILFRNLDKLRSDCERLRWNENLSTIRLAVSGRGFLSTFRYLLLPTCAIMSIMIWVGIAGSVCLAITAITGNDFLGSYNPVLSTAQAIEFIFGMQHGSYWSELIVRLFFVAFAAVVLSTVFWSVGNLLQRNLLVHRSLRKLSGTPHFAKDGTPLSAIIDELSTHAGRTAPNVCVRESLMPHACAHEFGLFRKKQYIEVSSCCLVILDSHELGAVLAHEWAHLIKHHCSLHRFMHLLGRIMFVGGAFVGALENSYAYELEADDCAVLELKIQPNVLKRALLKLRAVATIQRQLSVADPQSLEFLPHSLVKKDKKHKRLHSVFYFKHTFNIWLLFYTTDTGISYWHPSIDDRIQSLSRFE